MSRGNIAEIRPGVWRFRVGDGVTLNGTARQRSSTFAATGRRAAERRATAVLREWDEDNAQRAAYKDTVSELVDMWVNWKAKRGESPTTAYHRRGMIAAIKADLGHIRLAKLSTLDIDQWYVDLLARPGARGRPISPNTVRHHHRVLHAILRQGRRWGKIPTNPADDASPPRAERHDQRRHMPTLEAVAVMVAKANPTVRLAVLLALGTGCRRGELVGLRWSDIAGDVLTVRRAMVSVPGSEMVAKSTKSGSERTIVLDGRLLAELAAHRESQAAFARGLRRKLAADGPILAHLRADPTGRTHHTPDWLSQEWERLCVRSGVTGLKLHGLRHLHASALSDAGVALATVSHRQGHAQVSTTANIYTQHIDASDRSAAATMGELMAPLYEGEPS